MKAYFQKMWYLSDATYETAVNEIETLVRDRAFRKTSATSSSTRDFLGENRMTAGKSNENHDPRLRLAGDVQPYVALGAGLKRAGYDVEIAADPYYASLVAGFGLTLAPVPAAHRNL